MSTATIGENAIHKVTVTSQADDLNGDPITIRYYDDSGTAVDGDTTTGTTAGNDIEFVTDFEGTTITPGFWAWELWRDDNTVTRQVGIDGEEDNNGYIRVTDSEKI